MKTINFLKHAAAALIIVAVALTGCKKDDPDEKTSYTVTFDSAGGSAVDALTVESGTPAKAPANPVRDGYVFLYWHLKDATTAYSFNTPVTADITLTAKWLEDDGTIEYFAVAWNLNGGAWPEGVIPSAKVVKGESLAEPNAPVKDGSAFDGWYKEAALTNKITFPYTVTADMALYAKWTGENGKTVASIAITEQPTKKTYAISEAFDPAGMVVTATYNDKSTEAVTLAAENFTYDFSAAGTDKTVTVTYEGKTATVNGITVTDYGPKADYFGTFRNAPAGDYVWEQFTIGPDRIMFLNGNGQYCTIENLTWTVTAEPPTPGEYPTDYSISGTVTGNNGDIVFPKDEGTGKAAVGDAVTLYFYLTPSDALWLGDFTSPAHEMKYGAYNKKTDIEYVQVKWELNGGSWPENDNHLTQAVKDGGFAVPNNPTKAGNNFAGWYTHALFPSTHKALFPYDMSAETGDITFYAKWTDASPSATLKVTVAPASGAPGYTFITAMRLSLGTPSLYRIPTNAGTHTVKVSPGTYYISVTYWSCSYVQCMSTGQSSTFTIETGQTRNISVVNSGVAVQ
jgi:uncharacterized repeat protein (TIGR02543 family)